MDRNQIFSRLLETTREGYWLIDNQTEIRNGRLLLPTGSGLGFDFLPQVVSQFAVESWQ